tara:strand:- start:492 stop:1367 length:876 start_codon:yes stop_codon:yes gene_type:complete
MKKKKERIKVPSRTKLRKGRGSTTNKQMYQNSPDPWKELSLKLQPLNRAYRNFKEKRRLAKEKEEKRRLKEQEELRIREEEHQKLMELEERKIKKEQKLKEQKEQKLKEEIEKKLKEKKLKLDHEEKIKKAKMYKERLLRAEEERLRQLDRVKESREHEKELVEQRRIKMEGGLKSGDKSDDALIDLSNVKIKLKDPKKKSKLLDQKEKDFQKINRSDEEKKNIFKGKVKWYNSAKGYGFIEREDGKKDIFIHSTALSSSGLETLKETELLTFEIEETDRGLVAINPRKIS